MERRALLTIEFMPLVGGLERLLHERAKNFEPQQITVFTPWSEGAEVFDRNQKYQIFRTKGIFLSVPGIRRMGQTLQPFFQFLKAHRKKPFNVIECGQALPFPVLAYLVHRIWGTPYIIYVFGNDLLAPIRYPILQTLLKKVLRSASRVVTGANVLVDMLLEQGVDRSKIGIFNQTADPERYRPGLPDTDLQKKYQLVGKRVILTVCRFVKRKGVDQVIRALPQVLKSHPDLVYLVVGDGPQVKEWRSLAKNLDIDRQVVFTGSVSHEDLPRMYHLAELFIMTSRFIPDEATIEGFGCVYLEANASGLPVIAGRTGGTPEIVKHGENGLLVNPESVDEIVQALNQLLSNSAYAKAMGKRGRELTLRPQDWSALTLRDLSRRVSAQASDAYPR